MPSELYPSDLQSSGRTDKLEVPQKTENEFNITPSEMKQFMRICILMGNLNFPQLVCTARTNYRISCIANAMTQKRFLSILANRAATTDDETPLGNTNVYWKIQVIIDVVLQIFKALEPEEHNRIKEVSYLR